MTARTGHHLAGLRAALDGLERDVPTLESWGARLAARLPAGSRLLVAGNGGSAAQAEHLSAELVGRYTADREPMSAIPLTGDAASLTAIANDYGPEQAFARQVAAHGRAGDVFLALSTSGSSRNVLTAAGEARRHGLLVWALTGPPPNPLAVLADEAVCVHAASTANVQEVHLVALHIMCGAVDRALGVEAALPVVGEVA